MTPRAMGRLYAPDDRDRLYPMSTVLPSTTLRRKTWWQEGWWGDQGADPHCVAFALAHWLADGPRPVSIFARSRPGVNTRELYCAAQKLDPWPGDCDDHQYDGTSVRAGVQALQAWGHVREYRWCYSADEVARTVLTTGPVIMGTLWYEGMSRPNAAGVMTRTGDVQGGHAYVVNGVNLDDGLFRIKNSWGRAWGQRGHAFIRLADLDALIVSYGDACVPIQQLPAPLIETVH